MGMRGLQYCYCRVPRGGLKKEFSFLHHLGGWFYTIWLGALKSDPRQGELLPLQCPQHTAWAVQAKAAAAANPAQGRQRCTKR
jgi:hypothetical protein